MSAAVEPSVCTDTDDPLADVDGIETLALALCEALAGLWLARRDQQQPGDEVRR